MSNGLASIGSLVLAGSGEYTPAMDVVDRHLLESCDGRRVVLVATACAQEGLDVMERWERMGVAHFERLGIRAVPLRIVDRDDANRPEVAEQLLDAGLVWFSGGSAAYLARTFDGSSAWKALGAANETGAGVAGASGGLGVLNPDGASLWGQQGPTGLGLAAPVRAMSHFDRIEARRPEAIARAIEGLAPGQQLVGVDEDTALVWAAGAWVAMGAKRVQVFERDAKPLVFHHGDRVDVLPPPERATAGGR